MKKNNLTGVLVLLVFAVFMVSVLLVLLSGADTVQKLTERDQRTYHHRTAVQYLTTRVRQADCAGAVSVDNSDDISTLILKEEIDGQLYHFTPKGIMVVLVNADLPVPSYYTPDLTTYIPWHEVDTLMLEPLTKMLENCTAAGYPYEFNSAYRSIKVQQEILSLRTQEYEAKGYPKDQAYLEARKTVALPGTSEHHLGLAVDILNVKDDVPQALEWLGQHCWEYGFIVRYAADKAEITGIVHEPWHFRYVGTRVSMEMKDSGLCLEEYLGAAAVDNPAIS